MIIAPIPCFLLNLIRIFGNILCTLNGITERLSSEREGFVDRFISQKLFTHLSVNEIRQARVH